MKGRTVCDERVERELKEALEIIGQYAAPQSMGYYISGKLRDRALAFLAKHNQQEKEESNEADTGVGT